MTRAHGEEEPMNSKSPTKLNEPPYAQPETNRYHDVLMGYWRAGKKIPRPGSNQRLKLKKSDLLSYLQTTTLSPYRLLRGALFLFLSREPSPSFLKKQE